MQPILTRRALVGSGLASLAAPLFPAPAAGDTVIPFLEPQTINPARPMVQWDQLTEWITPTEQFFAVAHYGYPDVKADGAVLSIGGLVDKPRSFTLAELTARPRREHTALLECAGNGSSLGFLGGIGNARWAGTPLAPILRECGIQPEGIEIVFFGADQGKETIRGKDYQQNFARSLALPDALKDTVLVGYEMNGQPLNNKHGAPLRLIVPGWYGVAWVKWMNRIEVHDRRFEGRFMGRDYVTIRGEQRGAETIWREMSVGRVNLKSIVGRVTRSAGGAVTIAGAAWNDGTPIKSVEVKIDDGPWKAAKLGMGAKEPWCWSFWSLEWPDAGPGEHTLVSRATDARGRVQPAAASEFIASKKTYWEANQQYLRKVKL